MPDYQNIELGTLEREAYGSGCATGDPFYAGVEQLARWLNGADHASLDPRMQQLLQTARGV